uniref:Uncharacterized protein n=1 Tax=Anguilla anguilla TaxID=7936 RepID=A0A0E9SHW8_ANGAN
MILSLKFQLMNKATINTNYYKVKNYTFNITSPKQTCSNTSDTI